MKQIDGEEDSALTWGDLCGRRSKLRNLTREGKLNVQKSAEAIVRGLLQQPAEGLNMDEG
ncbi:hypothetical protein [Paenibacillus herberti]|uniref:hypothetical protein n=1 Tax=Paenibacillus herberti TaxID=1619309 RepID=UPI00113128F0|nr:hypothetical protein [Paenibacillus herberti]